jgi:hypothetical protein
MGEGLENGIAWAMVQGGCKELRLGVLVMRMRGI